MERQGLSTGATVALMIARGVVLVGSGILLGALVISSDDDAAVDSVAGQGNGSVNRTAADRAALATAIVSDAAIRAEGAGNEAAVDSASASLAYLQGVASLNNQFSLFPKF